MQSGQAGRDGGVQAVWPARRHAGRERVEVNVGHGSQLGIIAQGIPSLEIDVTAESLHQAFDELGLRVPVKPLPQGSFTGYMRRCPQQVVLDVVRWANHGIRP